MDADGGCGAACVTRRGPRPHRDVPHPCVGEEGLVRYRPSVVRPLAPAHHGRRVHRRGLAYLHDVVAHHEQERFTEWVSTKLAPRLRPGQIVILDNLRAHHADRVRELIEASGAELKFLPPYSPRPEPNRILLGAHQEGAATLRSAREGRAAKHGSTSSLRSPPRPRRCIRRPLGLRERTRVNTGIRSVAGNRAVTALTLAREGRVTLHAYLAWAFDRLGTHRDVFALPFDDMTPAAFKASPS